MRFLPPAIPAARQPVQAWRRRSGLCSRGNGGALGARTPRVGSCVRAPLAGHRRPCLVAGRDAPTHALAPASVAVAATRADLVETAAKPCMAARGVDRRDCLGRGAADAWSMVSAVARCRKGPLPPAPSWEGALTRENAKPRCLGLAQRRFARLAEVFGSGPAPVRLPWS